MSDQFTCLCDSCRRPFPCQDMTPLHLGVSTRLLCPKCQRYQDGGPQSGFPVRLSEAVCWKPWKGTCTKHGEQEPQWPLGNCPMCHAEAHAEPSKPLVDSSALLRESLAQMEASARGEPVDVRVTHHHTPEPPPHHTGLADCRCLACIDRRAARTPEPPTPAQNPLVALLNRYGNPHAYSQVRSIISPHELRTALQQYAA